MDSSDVFRAVGAVAGLGGLAIGAVLIFYREVIRTIILPKLDRERGYRVIRMLTTFMFLVSLAGIASWTYVVHAGGLEDAEEQITKRVAEAHREYDRYAKAFAEAVNTFADENLEKIFAECISQVSSQDPSIPFLLAALSALPVEDEKQRDALREQLTAKVLPHRATVERVIFERFNTRLMDELRSLASKDGCSPWMTRALLEWTHMRNDDSWLVQGCITKLLADVGRLGSWIYAYVRREKESFAWSKTSQEPANMRFDLLSTLERLVGNALNEGRSEVIQQVRRNFPSMSAVPSSPSPERSK